MSHLLDSMPTYSRTPDQLAPDVLIKTHTMLVRKLAWHLAERTPPQIEMADLIQIGMIALIEAARCYEDRGHKFASYASPRIRGAMLDYLRAQSHLHRSAMRFRRDHEQARSKMRDRLGREPSLEEVAAELGLSPEETQSRINKSADIRLESVDEVYSEHSLAFAAEDNAAELLERHQLEEAIRAGIKTLPEREQLVLSLYYIEELNQNEIGAVLGLTAARICQIKAAALGKLRTQLVAHR